MTCAGEPANGHLGASGGQQRFLGLNLCTKMHSCVCGYGKFILVSSYGISGQNPASFWGFDAFSMAMCRNHAFFGHVLLQWHNYYLHCPQNAKKSLESDIILSAHSLFRVFLLLTVSKEGATCQTAASPPSFLCFQFCVTCLCQPIVRS